MPRQTERLSEDVLNAALEGLEAQKQKLDEQIQQVRSMLGMGGVRRGRPPKAAATQEVRAAPAKKARRKRKLSAEGRKRIIEATRKRWAAYRAKKEK
jgi:hypothetical protein